MVVCLFSLSLVLQVAYDGIYLEFTFYISPACSLLSPFISSLRSSSIHSKNSHKNIKICPFYFRMKLKKQKSVLNVYTLFTLPSSSHVDFFFLPFFSTWMVTSKKRKKKEKIQWENKCYWKRKCIYNLSRHGWWCLVIRHRLDPSDRNSDLPDR